MNKQCAEPENRYSHVFCRAITTGYTNLLRSLQIVDHLEKECTHPISRTRIRALENLRDVLEGV
jgi:hypothetical protein